MSIFDLFSSGKFILCALSAHDAQREAAASRRWLHVVSAHVSVRQSQRQVWKRVTSSLRQTVVWSEYRTLPWASCSLTVVFFSWFTPTQRTRSLQHSSGPVPEEQGGPSLVLHDIPHHPERVSRLHQGFENGPYPGQQHHADLGPQSVRLQVAAFLMHEWILSGRVMAVWPRLA